MVWMNEKPLEPNRSYLLKHTTQSCAARVRDIRLPHRRQYAGAPARACSCSSTESGVVSVEAQRPLFFDPYRKNRFTGSFILIDPITNETLGAGMILQEEATQGVAGRVTDVERRAVRGHGPLAICLPPGHVDLAWLLERPSVRPRLRSPRDS